jgi:heme A synthase
MLHRYMAGLFLVPIAGFAITAWRTRAEAPWAGPLAVAAPVLFIAQVMVGAFNVWYTFPDQLTISHTVIASLVWFTLSSAATLAWYSPASVRRPVGPFARGEVPA